MPGTEDAPEKGGPFPAGIHGDPDPAGIRSERGDAGGIVIRPAGQLGIGAGKLLITAEPEGGRNIPVGAQHFEKGIEGFIGFQPFADRYGIAVGHRWSSFRPCSVTKPYHFIIALK